MTTKLPDSLLSNPSGHGGGGGGGGDVVGPAGSTNNAVARFDLATGLLIQNSVVIIDDSGNVSGLGTLNTHTIQGGTGTLALTSDITGTNSGTNTGDQTISDATISLTDITTNDTTITKHGFAPKLPNDAAKFLDGLGNWTVPPDTGGSGDVVGPASSVNNRVVFFDGTTGKLIKDSGITLSGSNTGDQTLPIDTTLTFTDNTDNNASTSKHGFLKKLSNVAGEYMNGQGNWVTPAGSGDVTGPASSTNNAMARFDLATGKLLQNSVVIVDDSGNMSGVGTLNTHTIQGGSGTLALLTDITGTNSGTNTGDQTISDATITTTDITTNDATTGKHGFLKKLGGGTTNFLRADGAWAAPPSGDGDVVGPASSVNDRVVFFDGTTGKLIKDSGITLSGSNTGDQTISDATISTTDITTNDATTSKHGFLKKLGGGTTNFLRADGAWAAPVGGSGDVVGPASSVNNRVVFFDGTTGKLVKDSGLLLTGSNTGDQTISDATISTTDITTNDATTSKHGFLPKRDTGTTKYLRTDGTWVVPPDTTVNATITLTGDVTGTGTGSFAATLGANKVITSKILDANVTLAKMADIATKTYIGRTVAATGVPSAVPVATLKTDLVLVKADVGLGSVDNTADTAKVVAGATEWNGAVKTVSTSAPTGGANDDIHFQYTA